MKNWLTEKLTAIRPVSFFIVTAAVFGLFFLVITPPFQGADEIVHFYRAYQVSESHIVESEAKSGAGGALPTSLGKVVDETQPSKVTFYPQNKYDEHKTKAALHINNAPQEHKFYEFSAAAPYSPASYLIASLGIFITRLLHMPTLFALYAGRLGDLLTWIVLMAFAISAMPRRKWALVAVGLLPMALFQAATLNGDATTIGSLALFLALILKYRDKKQILTKKQLVILSLVAILMVLSKQVMFIFLPLLVLLKNNCFSSRRQAWLIKTALIIVPLACFLLWMSAVYGLDAASAHSNGQDPHAQLRFIIKNPHSYINVVWNTYFYTWGDNVTRSFVGVFGWADTPLSELIVTIGYIGLAALFISTTTDKVKKWLSGKEKVLLWSVIIAYWAVTTASLYLYYSPVGFKIVYGLQGRYFIPLAVLAVPLLVSKRVRIDKGLYKSIAVYLPLFLLTASTITLYVRYFVNNV